MKSLAALALMSVALVACGSCAAQVEDVKDQTIPPQCGKGHRMVFWMDRTDHEYVAAMREAGDRWSARTDGCLSIAVEEVDAEDIAASLCHVHQAVVSDGQPRTPNGGLILGTANRCSGSNAAYIQFYRRHIGPDGFWKVTIADHELGHVFGFTHGGYDGCTMYEGVGYNTKWCDYDQVQCVHLGFCR